MRLSIPCFNVMFGFWSWFSYGLLGMGAPITMSHLKYVSELSPLARYLQSESTNEKRH